MKLKNYSILLLVVILGVSVLVKAFWPSQVKDQNQLVIGLQSGYPPFEFMNHEGKLVGFDLDVAEQIAKRLNRTLVVRDMEFEGEILSLQQGKIDLIVSGMNITPSRLKEIAMIPYHGESASCLSLIFWNEVPENIHTLGDLTHLDNAVISVESGTISENYLQHYQITAKSFQGALAPLMDVKYGKSIANCVEPDVALYLQQQHPEIRIVNIPLEWDQPILGFGIGIKKENAALIAAVREIVEDLKVTGELKKLEDKWFGGGISWEKD